MRVASEATEAAWLERAQRVTVRRLDDEVRWAEARQALREAHLVESTPEERKLGLCAMLPPPEGMDLRRDAEALAAVARECSSRHTFAPGAAQVTLSFAVEPNLAAG